MRRAPRRVLVAAMAATLAIISLVPASASAADTATAIAALNAQRSGNAIPGGVTGNAGWSASCAKHNAYMQANGILTHVEDPTAPAFTADGAWAGINAVLAYALNVPGATSWATNPWENAPFHLAQVLQPGLRSVGYADDGAYSCMTTWPGVDDGTVAGGVYTYPGMGRTGVPHVQTANELPSTPQQSVGIAASAPTGPNLLVFAHGLGGTAVRVKSATLTPPVELKWVDAATPAVGALIPSGAILVPTSPLQPDTTYTASVALAGSSKKVVHEWSFTTGTAAAAAAAGAARRGTVQKLSVSFAVARGRKVRVTGTASGGRITVSVQPKRRGAKPVKRVVKAAPSGVFHTTVTSRVAGKATVCASVGAAKRCVLLKL